MQRSIKAIQTKVSSHNVGPLINFITLMQPASHKSCPLLFSIVTFTSIHYFIQHLFAILYVLNFFGHGNPALAIWRVVAASMIFPLLCRRRGRLLMTSHLRNAVTTKHHFIYGSVFQPFSSRGTFQKLLSVWRNLHTQNSANLRILRERSQELAEPRLKNTDLR